MVTQGTLYLSLFVATFAVSWAAVLIKMTGAGPLPTAFYRMGFAALIIAVPALPKVRKTIRHLSSKEIWLLMTSGIVLGLHFATWVTSLFFTTISNSTILVATQPMWVLIMEALILKQKIPARSAVGMALALVGMIVISRGDFDLGDEYILGDALALMGAVCAATYLFIGRQLRANLDNLDYVFPVYAISALTLLLISLLQGENLVDYPVKTWLLFLLRPSTRSSIIWQCTMLSILHTISGWAL